MTVQKLGFCPTCVEVIKVKTYSQMPVAVIIDIYRYILTDHFGRARTVNKTGNSILICPIEAAQDVTEYENNFMN